jgi:hypothetical protein
MLMFTAMLTIIFGMGGQMMDTFNEITNSWFVHQERSNEHLDTKITRADNIPVTAVTYVQLTWKNEGNVSLSQFDDWDVIVEVDEDPGIDIKRLTYATSTPLGENEWTVQGMYLDASTLTGEITDLGVFNPDEEMVALANPFPAVTKNTYHRMRFTTPNGYSASVIFYSISPNLFLHSETTVVGTTTFRNLEDGNTADGTATTTSVTFAPGQTGRVRPSQYDGKFLYPLDSIAALSRATWDMTYRVKHNGGGFTWFVNAFDISLSTTGSWQDISVSTYLPDNATGAIVEVVNTGGSSSYSGVLRGKEDTRDYMSNASYEEIEAETHRWQIVKIDSDNLIQGYIENASIDFKLLGYTTGSDPSYFDTPPDVTPGATGAWTTVDVSSYVDDDADGVILFIDSISCCDRDFGVREVGSSFNVTDKELEEYGNTMYMVGIDGNNEFDFYRENAWINVYLVAQTKGSVVYYVDDIQVADPPTGSWQELDADDYSVPSEASGLVFRVYNNSSSNDRRIGLTHGDSTDSWNTDIGNMTQFQASVGINDDNIWDEYMESTAVGVQIAAYTIGGDITVHADVDILIRKANGDIRDTIGSDIANTTNIVGDDWQSLTASYDFSGYTVVASTDYLEIDLFAEATSNSSGLYTTVDFRIDDPSIPPDNQTHLHERLAGN